MFNGPICPIDVNNKRKCAKIEFFDIKSIEQSHWSQTNTPTNGTIGLANFVSHMNYYSLDIGNLTDWTWN